MDHIISALDIVWLCSVLTHDDKEMPAAASQSVPAVTDQVANASLCPQARWSIYCPLAYCLRNMSCGNQLLSQTSRADRSNLVHRLERRELLPTEPSPQPLTFYIHN